jgi:hypothetical protein
MVDQGQIKQGKHPRGSLGYARDRLFDCAPSSAVSRDKSVRRPFPLCHPEHPDLPAASCERNEQHPQAVVATTTSNESATLPFVIPSEPGFPATQHWTRPRMRLSVRKGAWRSPKPPTSTGNPGKPRNLQFYGPVQVAPAGCQAGFSVSHYFACLPEENLFT